MDITAHCPLATSLAARLRNAREELTAHWLDRIAARVAIDRNTVFPTEELLDHIPLLIAGVADYLEDPAREISADVPVVAKAMELGELRYAQGFDAYEILKEYEILGSILFAFLARVVGDLDDPCSRAELLVCAHRVFRAIAIIQESTTIQFLRKTSERVREREARLRTFNHAISHELKNHLHSAIGASQLLEEDVDVDRDAQRRLLAVIARNLALMNGRLESLLELTRIAGDARRQRHVLLPQAAAEAARLLREAAAARGVSLRLASDLPPIEVHAAAVELALSNYLSNAIKYSDPAKSERWAEVRGAIREYAGGAWDLVVEVRDNGLGVPPDARSRLFARFARAHEDVASGVEGTGLGLSIVRETVESLGGRAWAEFPTEGSVFAFSLPCRRESDACGAGEGREPRA